MSFSLAIHGGAGTILPSQMTPQLEQAYLQALNDAMEAGCQLLQAGGSAQAAVVAAVSCLEDHVLFNAGRGSVYTNKGGFEMDASLMLGHNLAAGAVAGVRSVKNPIQLAQAVMEHTEHVMLAGDGAVQFAINQGLPLMPDSYFHSDFRYQQWQAVRDSETYALDHNLQPLEQLMKDKKFGTVGAVACDAHGNLAAATSTGGMTNKRYGRVGDTPIIGAGTYANNHTCAISATGHGELFMKAVAAYDVSCLMEYRGMTLQEAMDEVVMRKLLAIGGEGGLIGVDKSGTLALVFNSAGMYRGSQQSGQLRQLAIYR